MQARGRRQPAPTNQPHRVEGWGESVWAKELALTGGAHLSGGAGTCTTSLGWTGQSWAEISFPFFSEFLIPFLFIFSSEIHSNSKMYSNSNNSNMCIKLKSNLGSP
jgi:hypothetical protein